MANTDILKEKGFFFPVSTTELFTSYGKEAHLKAVINSDKCVGCGMCAKKCPASIIEIREVAHHA